MSVIEGKVGYFGDPGSQNSDEVIKIVENRIRGDDIRTVVVASTSGETGVKFAKALKGISTVVVVSHEEMKVSGAGIGSIQNTHPPMDEAVKTIQRTLDLEVNFIDTSVDYEDSEERIGKAIVGRREHVIISTKTWAGDKTTAPRR